MIERGEILPELTNQKQEHHLQDCQF